MSDFDLNKFLKNHKPKKLEDDLQSYIECDKLKSYKLFKRNATSNLISGMAYIKYIKINDAFVDDNFSSHIKSGGMFVNGGIFDEGKFKPIKNVSQWTHFMLKTVPFPTKNDDTDEELLLDSHVFFITVSDYYIFYKIIRHNYL
jgi:hypothetical protein